MSLNFCDLLVIGSDLSGIMAATLLAKRGLNVLVLDDDPEGITLPEPNLVTGLGTKSFKSFMGKLMIPESKLQILHENPVSVQVIFPKHRLDVSSQRPLYLKEIQREFPQDMETIQSLFQELDKIREAFGEELVQTLPYSEGKDRKKFLKWLEQVPQEPILRLWDSLSPTARSFFQAQIKFFSRYVLIEPLLLQLLLFVVPENLSSFSVKGGLKELKKIFFDKLDYFGGLIHPLNEDSFTYETKGSEIRGIQLTRYNFPTRCRYLLGNTDIKRIYQELPTPIMALLKGQKKKVAALEASERKGFLQYMVHKNFLPEPMKENVIIISDPEQPLQGTNYLELNIHPLYRNATDAYDTLMTVTYCLPVHDQEMDVDPLVIEQLQDQIDQALHKILPFTEGHLKRVFPRDKTPTDQGELFSSDEDMATSQKILQRKVTYQPVIGFPTMDAPYKNMRVVGPNILEWYGMEGKMIAAMGAVESLWNQELKVKNS